MAVFRTISAALVELRERFAFRSERLVFGRSFTAITPWGEILVQLCPPCSRPRPDRRKAQNGVYVVTEGSWSTGQPVAGGFVEAERQLTIDGVPVQAGDRFWWEPGKAAVEA